jgi:ABC-2 type transport system ATP-binding protein
LQAAQSGEGQNGRSVAIEVSGATKVYSHGFRAVDGISFAVSQGEVFGLLGPNGAGKTTTIKMITTLTNISAGTISVFGKDVAKSPGAVREMIGYVPQNVSVDPELTGYENLLILSKLYFVPRGERESRIADALRYMGLAERAGDMVKNYSGGMMRRLEIAQALVSRPSVLFLDEPSIGLDPNSRRRVWESVQELTEAYKTTIVLTTHDMIEADMLCDRVAIIDTGKIAAIGTPDALKKEVGGDVVLVGLSTDAQVPPLPPELGQVSSLENGTLKIVTVDGNQAVPKILGFLAKNGISSESVTVSKPSLDDVFVKYTQKHLDEQSSLRSTKSARRSFRSHAR